MLKKFYLLFITLCLVLSAKLVMNTSLPATANSQPTPQNQGVSNRRETLAAQRSRPARIKFNLPNVKASGTRIGAGARGRCSIDGNSTIEIKALLPETNVGLTVAKYPTFFVHVPPTSARQAMFLLLNEKGDQVVYEKTLSLSGTAGIISFSLPANKHLPPLKVGEKYNWFFSIICDHKGGPSGDPQVDGWVQRVETPATLANNLNNATVRDRPALYAEAGIWQDSLKTLAELRRANPRDATLAADWIELLNSAKLGTIARDPLVQLRWQ